MSTTAVAKTEGKAAPDQKEIDEAQVIINGYNALRQKITQLATKIDDINIDRQEHLMCVEALTPLEAERRCFRNINGVLVERTVGEVLPLVQKNLTGIDQILSKLADEVVKYEKECDAYKLKHNLKMASKGE